MEYYVSVSVLNTIDVPESVVDEGREAVKEYIEDFVLRSIDTDNFFEINDIKYDPVERR